MTPHPNATSYPLTWEGVALTVTHTPNYFGLAERVGSDFARDHLEVTAADRQPLPITETGYRSHFLHPDELAAGGGPVAYVRRWIEEAASSPEWLAAVAARRQLALF